MIKFIGGAKGAGKTKIIIDMANDNVESAKGDIVFVTDTDKYSYVVRYPIRTINTGELKDENKVISTEKLVGFIQGVLAGNHDIESFYIDGAHRMLNKTVGEMKDFFDSLNSIAKQTETTFIVTVSESEDKYPEFLKNY